MSPGKVVDALVRRVAADDRYALACFLFPAVAFAVVALCAALVAR